MARDDDYDAWGQDRRKLPEEDAYWESMRPGAQDEYHTNFGRRLSVARPGVSVGGYLPEPQRVGHHFQVCETCGRSVAARETCVACGDET